jgi:hypothetical protein
MTLQEAIAALEALGNAEKAAEAAAYHKVNRRYLGVSVPQITDLATAWRADLALEDRVALASGLWDSDIHVAKVAAATALCASFGIDNPVRAALVLVPAVELAAILPLTPGNVGLASAAVALASSATLVFTKRAARPSSSASASPSASFRSAMTALPPPATIMRAVPAPSPDAPPVTMNVLPLSSMAFSLSAMWERRSDRALRSATVA